MLQARGVFQRVQLEFTAETELTLLHFFRGILTSAIEPEAGTAKVEAVAALGYIAETCTPYVAMKNLVR